MEIRFDASELAQLGRVFQRIPAEIKARAFNRAMGRMRDMARTRVVRQSAERTDLPPSIVRAITTAKVVGGGAALEIAERSGWIALSRLNAKQNSKGVAVRGRGSIRHAFKLKSGSGAVMIREGDERYPIKELFGPNPAHDIVNNPDEFLPILVELIEDHLAPRVLHEIERLLPG
jgi:hypothetical protein